MNDDLEALARRAVACKAWRWVPGMVDQYGRRVLRTSTDREGFEWVYYADKGGSGWMGMNLWAHDVDGVATIPDLDDAATRGCLLELVRDAWEDDCMHAEPESTAWRVWRRIYPMGMAGEGPSEVAALVVALEAAPEKVQP